MEDFSLKKKIDREKASGRQSSSYRGKRQFPRGQMIERKWLENSFLERNFPEGGNWTINLNSCLQSGLKIPKLNSKIHPGKQCSCVKRTCGNKQTNKKVEGQRHQGRGLGVLEILIKQPFKASKYHPTLGVGQVWVLCDALAICGWLEIESSVATKKKTQHSSFLPGWGWAGAPKPWGPRPQPTCQRQNSSTFDMKPPWELSGPCILPTCRHSRLFLLVSQPPKGSLLQKRKAWPQRPPTMTTRNSETRRRLWRVGRRPAQTPLWRKSAGWGRAFQVCGLLVRGFGATCETQLFQTLTQTQKKEACVRHDP